VIVERPDSAPVAPTPLGAPGTADGTATADASEAVLVPALFVAVTVNVYAVPFVRPVTVHVVRVVAPQVAPPGAAVTRYPLTAAPPVSAGAVHTTTELEFTFEPAITVVGTPGTVAGTTAAEAADNTEPPDTLIAITLNVYDDPFVKPVTTQLVSPLVTQVRPPGVAVTLYPVISAPPFDADADQVTVD